MQSIARNAGQTASVKIYNAVYSSVQVYECMVRGIAVMRRRADSYVNATQILKVAGVDKGRRTKILEKEILPGKHEIVQGGYGKYQGTWIPLERGREIATQYGVAPLLAPLFDFMPSASSLGSLPQGNPTSSPRPLSASSSFSSIGGSNTYTQGLAPPPIMPGSALRLLNQGRAQGLFTPSTSNIPSARSTLYPSPFSSYHRPSSYPGVSPTPPPTQQMLKRTRSDVEGETSIPASSQPLSNQGPLHSVLDPAIDIPMPDRSRPASSLSQANSEDGPSPTKRPRKDPAPAQPQPVYDDPSRSASNFLSQPVTLSTRPTSDTPISPPPQAINGSSRPSSNESAPTNVKSPDAGRYPLRFASKPTMPRTADIKNAMKDPRRAAILASICQHDDPNVVIEYIRQMKPDTPSLAVDYNVVLDDQGHTALHVAASFGLQDIVDILIRNGADIHCGNIYGETPLIRACLATNNADQQSFGPLVASLHPSIHTLDSSRKSVLHHIMSVAGLPGRSPFARYYLDQIFSWIAHHQGGDFKSVVDLQDENGDTALLIAAKVGNRSLVRTLLDVGANRVLPNNVGLRPGDFGVEVEELSGPPRAEDILGSLRSAPTGPVQKSQDVIADISAMLQTLNTEFNAEIKAKQDTLEVTQAHLRVATRELSEQRRKIQMWQARCAELDQVRQRIRNLETAIQDEDNFDWTGRTDLSGGDSGDTHGPAFKWRGQSSTMVGIGGTMDISFTVDTEPPIPTTDSVANLIRLRRLGLWHQRMEEMMEARLKSLQGASAEKEYQCKKIVALCTGIPIDKVEDMLENLVIAMESESQIIDIGRVSGFMQKVRDGII